jgi:acyl-CoA thioesterase
MTIHYLSRPMTGDADVAVTTLRVGRGHATYRVELAQDGELRCAGLVTCGRLRDAGPLDFQPDAPDVPSAADSIAVRRIGEAPTLWERLDTRSARRQDLFFFKTEAGEAATGGWTRLADGRPTDALAIAVFLDCWPPAIFNRTMRPDPSGAPTLEYTVHWRNRPTSDWCYAWFETTTFAGGYVDENGVLFDENGVLVAESRQLARYSGAPPG